MFKVNQAYIEQDTAIQILENLLSRDVWIAGHIAQTSTYCLLVNFGDFECL